LVESVSGRDERYNSQGMGVVRRCSEHGETEVVFRLLLGILSPCIQCPINDSYRDIYRQRFASHV